MSDIDNPDITEADTQFGRAADRKAEEADRLAEQGLDPRTEGHDNDPPVRAGNKAEPVRTTDPDEDRVDEALEDTFPASDPPANY